MLGKHHSEEVKKKMSASHAGVVAGGWPKGKSQSAIHSRRISEALKDFYIMYPEKRPTPMDNPIARARQKEALKKPEVRAKISISLRGANAPNWRGGCYKDYSPEFTKELKEQIRNRDDRLCQMPGCCLSENRKKHSVHHIDYDKKNSVHKNLITLCESCHAKTDNGDRSHWTELFQELQLLRGL